MALQTNNIETATAWYPNGAGLSTSATHAVYAAAPVPQQGVPSLAEATVLAGRYRVGEVLGSGGFATVYSAWDLALRRWVAVKVTVTGAMGRISEDEARLQATCQHPNIMPLHDAGQDPLLGIAFLVMPLYPGADLAATLNRYGPMPYRSALLCVDQIAGALEFLLQRRQTIHGDIKPANIWLTQGGSALLMDFNLRGLLARGETLRAGTPGYTAPEALEGRVSPASDVFSLGCVLYQCLTGKAPFADDQAVRSGAYAALRQLRPDIRPELEAVIHTALARTPEQRYQTPREFQTALRRPPHSSGFLLFLLATLLRKLWRGLVPVYRVGWRTVGKIVRHAIRRPKQALIEALVAWLIGRYLIYAANIWLKTHPYEVRIATIAILALAGAGSAGYVQRLHRMWKARGARR